MKPQSTPSFTAFVGIDWADKKHDFCIQAAGSDQRVCGTSLGVQVDTNHLSLLEDTDSL